MKRRGLASENERENYRGSATRTGRLEEQVAGYTEHKEHHNSQPD